MVYTDYGTVNFDDDVKRKIISIHVTTHNSHISHFLSLNSKIFIVYFWLYITKKKVFSSFKFTLWSWLCLWAFWNIQHSIQSKIMALLSLFLLFCNNGIIKWFMGLFLSQLLSNLTQSNRAISTFFKKY